MKIIWNKIKNPPIGAYILTYLLTLCFTICSILSIFIFISYQNILLKILIFLVWIITSISLSYTIYLIVISRKAYKPTIYRIFKNFPPTSRLIDYIGYRKFVYMIWSFILSIGYVSVNLFLGITLRSIWYCSLASYNLFLLLMRGSILLYHNNRRKNKGRSFYQDKLSQAKTYLLCGVFLSILNVALSVAISEVIFHDMHYIYYSWTIYAFAAFAFYKITMAIYRKIRYRKETDLTERAARSFNLAGACFSVMGLQTALLSSFAHENANNALFNTLTGVAVSIITVTLSFVMMINGIKRYKKSKKELIKQLNQI